MLNKFDNRKIIKTLLIIIIILYIIFMSIDLFDLGIPIVSNILKFISVILCFILSIFYKDYAIGANDMVLLRIGLFITVFADLFLLILDRHYILGIFLFSIVQIVYIIRYSRYNNSNKNIKREIRKEIKRPFIIFLILFSMYGFINLFIMKGDFFTSYRIVLCYMLIN